MTAPAHFGFSESLRQHPEATHALLFDGHRPVDEHHPLHLTQLASRHPALKLQVVPRRDFAGLDQVCPWLVEVAFPNQNTGFAEELIEDAWNRALADCTSPNGAYVCGLLTSYSPLPELAEHLARAMPVPHRSISRWIVPVFEPLRLALLESTVNPEWMSDWLGPIAQWRTVDTSATLHLIENTREPGSLAASAPRPPALPDAAHAWQDSAPVIARAVWAWRELVEPLPPDALQHVCSAMSLAAKNGLTAEEDTITFAVGYLSQGEAWLHRADTRAALARAGTDEMTFGQALAEA